MSSKSLYEVMIYHIDVSSVSIPDLICIMNLHCWLHKYSFFRVSKSFYSNLVNNGWLDSLDFDIVVDKRQFTPLFPELIG